MAIKKKNLYEWFWRRVDDHKSKIERRKPMSLFSWIKEFEGLGCRLFSLIEDPKSDDINDEIEFAQGDTLGDAIEYLDRLAEAVALHGAIRSKLDEIGETKL